MTRGKGGRDTATRSQPVKLRCDFGDTHPLSDEEKDHVRRLMNMFIGKRVYEGVDNPRLETDRVSADQYDKLAAAAAVVRALLDPQPSDDAENWQTKMSQLIKVSVPPFDCTRLPKLPFDTRFVDFGYPFYGVPQPAGAGPSTPSRVGGAPRDVQDDALKVIRDNFEPVHDHDLVALAAAGDDAKLPLSDLLVHMLLHQPKERLQALDALFLENRHKIMDSLLRERVNTQVAAAMQAFQGTQASGPPAPHVAAPRRQKKKDFPKHRIAYVKEKQAPAKGRRERMHVRARRCGGQDGKIR
jgi:hypothetical protein